MSTSYYMYTGVNINGKWICINNKITNIEKGKEVLSENNSYDMFTFTYSSPIFDAILCAKAERRGDSLS